MECGKPMLDQHSNRTCGLMETGAHVVAAVSEGLCPVERTHPRAVNKELQPLGRTHIGEDHRGLCAMRKFLH